MLPRRTVNTFLALIVLSSLLFSTAMVHAEKPQLVIDTGGHKSKIWEVLFTSDGQHLVSAGDDKVVRVWDTRTGEVVRTILGQIEEGREGKIYAAALSPDNRILAIGGAMGLPNHRIIRLHNFQTGEVLGLLKGHTNVVQGLAFSPDGHYLVSSGADNTVRLWDVKRKEIIHVLKGHTNYIDAVTFSPDGKRIASGSSDKTIRLWNAKTGEFLKVLGRQDSSPDSLSFSPDGKRLLTGYGVGGRKNEPCHIFAVPSGEILTQFTQHDNVVLATAFSSLP